jgi:type I restriction enzyme S subunit
MPAHGVVTTTKEQISDIALKDVLRGKKVPAGTLIMSFKLTIGRVATLGIDACHNEAIIAVYPKEGVDQRYLGYFLAQVDYDALQDRQVKGNTLNQEKLDRIEVTLPPLDEQLQIAAVLDLLRRAIRLEEDALRATEQLKSAAMRYLFTRGLRGEAMQETVIGSLPSTWTAKQVAQVGTVKGGKRLPKGVSLVKNNTGRPYIRVTDFKGHGVNETGILYVPLGIEDKIRRYRISTKDVYVSIAGTIGLVGQVPDSLEDANLTEYAAKIVFAGGRALPRFTMYALASPACQNQIQRATAKNAQPKLALTRLEQVVLPLPSSLDEQHEIVAILDAIERKIDVHRRKRRVLDSLFRTLLAKLMKGEFRVADLNLAVLDQQLPPKRQHD